VFGEHADDDGINRLDVGEGVAEGFLEAVEGLGVSAGGEDLEGETGLGDLADDFGHAVAVGVFVDFGKVYAGDEEAFTPRRVLVLNTGGNVLALPGGHLLENHWTPEPPYQESVATVLWSPSARKNS